MKTCHPPRLAVAALLLALCAPPVRAGAEADEPARRAEAAAARAEDAARRAEEAAARTERAINRLELVLEELMRRENARAPR